MMIYKTSAGKYSDYNTDTDGWNSDLKVDGEILVNFLSNSIST